MSRDADPGAADGNALRVLVTAGPTREPIDPVRYLSNRSSGRMGFAVAEAALKRGHEATLVTGPVALEPPSGCRVIRVETAAQMHAAVAEECGRGERPDVAVMAAAVADYRMKEICTGKIKKDGETMVLELVRTRDILADMRARFGYRGILVGFAAETENVVENALEKMKRKGCDAVVANPVGASAIGVGFDSAENEITVCLRGGLIDDWGRASKQVHAERLMELCERLVRNSSGTRHED